MLVQAVTEISHFLKYVSYQRLFPLMERFYGLIPFRLYPDDVFIAKYTGVSAASTDPNNATLTPPQSSLKAHRDNSEFSFVIMLSDVNEYEGGGTHFLYLNKSVKPPRGSAVIFSGQNVHEAVPVTSGTRYIVAGFTRYAGAIPAA